MLNKIITLLLLLGGWHTATFAQTFEAPPPQIDRELEAGYRDSVYQHQNTDLHYRPHCCRNRYGKYGWVGKHHQVLIPFVYDQFPTLLTDFNLARKGKLHGAVDAQGRELLPFNYSGLTPLYKQERVICANGAYRKSVLDFKGRVIIPEDSLRTLWLFNDTTLALQFFKTNETKLYNLQGKYIKTWNYKYITELPSGRFSVGKDTLIGTSLLSVSGLLDAAGKQLIPMQYTSIQWEQGDWARVLNHKTKVRGLYRISTQTFYPDQYYSIAPPDPNGNFRFLIGETSGQATVGLMDSSFKTIFPPVYHNIQYLDEKGHYLLGGSLGLRGRRCGVGNAAGEMVIDTVLSYFKQLVFDKADQTLSKTGYVEYDTLPFWTYEYAKTDQKGLWHRQLGQLRPPEYDRIEAVSHTAYVLSKNDTSYLYHADGRLLAGPYYSMRPLSSARRYLLAQKFAGNAKGAYWVLLDLEGQLVKELESEPRQLTQGIFYLIRYVEQGYRNGKKYALFDQDLNPITDFVYEAEPWPLDLLKLEQRIRLLELEHPVGYGPWVGYLKSEGPTLLLLDDKGNTWELK